MPQPTHNLTIRIKPEEYRELQNLTERYKVSQATVVRWAIDALNDYIEKNNGRVTLPVDFTEILNASPAQSLVAEPSPGEITSGKTSSSDPDS